MMTGSYDDDSQFAKDKMRQIEKKCCLFSFHFACFNSGLGIVSAIRILWSAGSETTGPGEKELDN